MIFKIMLVNSKKFIIFFLLILILFFFWPRYSEATTSCQLVNVLTDKNQVGPGERMQINITAKKECIGQSAVIKICDAIKCADIAPQTFGSRRVNGQEAINPIVLFIVPSDFIDKNTTAFVQAAVRSSTVKSRTISIMAVEDKAQYGEFCAQASQCSEGLICAGNACVECNSNNPCTGNKICADGACVSEDELPPASGGNKNTNLKNNVLTGFPGEDLEANDVIKIVIGLSCWLTRVAFTLTVIFVILAGFKFMAAQGNQTKYGEAVKNFQTVLWGVLVIYGVYVIIATVAQVVGMTGFSFIPLVC